MANVKLEEALASIQTKLDALSGIPPDLTEEFDAIRKAANAKPAAKKAEEGKK